MGALEDLAAALAGQQIQGQLSQHNAYADLAGLAGGIGNSAISLGSANPKRFKTGEVVGTSLASGVLQGLLGNLGESYQAGLTDQYQNVIKNTLLGQPVDSGSLPTSIFKSGQDAANIFKLKQAMASQEAAQQLAQAKGMKIFEAMVGKGKVPIGFDADGQPVAAQLFDPIAEAADKAQAEAAAKVRGENEAWGLSAMQNPNSPQYKTNKDSEAALADLRGELQKSDAFKQYEQAQKGYKVLLKAVSDPTATSDLDFVYGAIQMIEPGMAVREGEQAAVANSTSIPEAWKGQLSKALNGESKLGEDVRAGIIRLAQRRYGEHAGTFNAARDFFESEATRRKLPNPGGVSYFGQAPDADAVAKSLGQAGPPAGFKPTGRTSGGKPVYSDGSKLWVE